MIFEFNMRSSSVYDGECTLVPVSPHSTIQWIISEYFSKTAGQSQAD